MTSAATLLGTFLTQARHDGVVYDECRFYMENPTACMDFCQDRRTFPFLWGDMNFRVNISWVRFMRR